MIRIVLLALIVSLVLWKLCKINKKVICAKSYIFLKEIEKGSSLDEANYIANLFDFFKKREANIVFHDMREALKKKYNKQNNKLIFRAQAAGFVNTHTRSMFKKRTKVMLIIEKYLLMQNPAKFTGNASELSKSMVMKYWDTYALLMMKLDINICALKIILEEYKETRDNLYPEIAGHIASNIQNDAKYLDNEDINIVSEWKDIIQKKKK